MTNVLKYIYLIIFFSSLIPNCLAQSDTLDSDSNNLQVPDSLKFKKSLVRTKISELKADTSIIEVRKPSVEKIETYRKDKDFDYDRYVEPPENEWDKFKRWLWGKILKIFDTSSPASYIWYGIFIILIIVLISRIMKTGIGGLFSRSRQSSTFDVNEIIEDIHELDLDGLIEQEIQSHNYRKAVRYLYLKLLKTLNRLSFIEWKIDKTNLDYYHELKKSKLDKDFKQLSLLFEYAWYGEFPIEEATFNSVKSKFDNFNEEIEKDK